MTTETQTIPTAAQLAAAFGGDYQGNGTATSGDSRRARAVDATTVERTKEIYIPQNPTAYARWTYHLTPAGWVVGEVPAGYSPVDAQRALDAALGRCAATA